MKQRLIIIAGVIAFLVTACQQDDADIFVEVPTTEEGVSVNISFSLSKGIQIDDELVPMEPGVKTRAGEDVIKTNISNTVKVILAKKINSQWILADYFDFKIDSTEKWVPIYHNVTDMTIFRPVEMLLTPGEYKITLITGYRSLVWNTIEKGTILEEGEDALWACTYRLTDNGYLNPGLPSLQEEIFAGGKEFEVKKADDLHSNPYPNDVQLTLQRKVGRLRFLLRERTSSDPGTSVDRNQPYRMSWDIDNTQDFFDYIGNGISAVLRLTDSTKKFSGGLNVWGKLQYSHYMINDQTTQYLGIFTWSGYQAGNDGQSYMIGMRNGTRQFGCNYFTDDGIELPIEVSDVRVTAFSGGPAYVFDGSAEGISIKHNTITGLIFESGNVNWVYSYDQSVEPQRELLVVKDQNGDPVKSEDKFNNYYEMLPTQ